MNIIKVALSHFCCRTTVHSDSVSVSSQAGDGSSLVDSTKHIVSQPERTTGQVERQEEKAHPEPVAAECSCHYYYRQFNTDFQDIRGKKTPNSTTQMMHFQALFRCHTYTRNSSATLLENI